MLIVTERNMVCNHFLSCALPSEKFYTIPSFVYSVHIDRYKTGPKLLLDNPSAEKVF